MEERTTHDCRLGCTGCGMNKHVECSMDGILKDNNPTERRGADE